MKSSRQLMVLFFLISVIWIFTSCERYTSYPHNIVKIICASKVQLDDTINGPIVQLLGVNADGDLEAALQTFNLLNGTLKVEVVYDSQQKKFRHVRGTVTKPEIKAYLFFESGGQKYCLNDLMLREFGASGNRVGVNDMLLAWEDLGLSEDIIECGRAIQGPCSDFAKFFNNRTISPGDEIPVELNSCIAEATVKIIWGVYNDDIFVPLRTGSGFYINEMGTILTNAHVIEQDPLSISKISKFLGNNFLYTGVLIIDKNDRFFFSDCDNGSVNILSPSEESDIGIVEPESLANIKDISIISSLLEKFENILKIPIDKEIGAYKISLSKEPIDEFDFRQVVFRNREDVIELASTIAVIGSGIGVSNSLKKGEISGSDKGIIYHNADILPGHSGSPIYDNRGRIVGVATMAGFLDEKPTGMNGSITHSLLIKLLEENGYIFNEE